MDDQFGSRESKSTNQPLFDNSCCSVGDWCKFSPPLTWSGVDGTRWNVHPAIVVTLL